MMSLRPLSLVALVACAEQTPMQPVVEPLPTPPPTAAETAKPKPTNDGVGTPVVLPSGLEYEDLRAGTGAVAQAGRDVVVHYIGKLEDGTVFDTSRKRGIPFTFHLGTGMVIKGWDEGIAGMREGQVRRLRMPPDLAYGQRGRPPIIPADATLTFEIELLEVR
jgi:peptidylprolyl isomerase